MKDLLTLIAEAIERDCSHLHVSPASSTIYLECDGRRYVVVVQDITEPVAAADEELEQVARARGGKP